MHYSKFYVIPTFLFLTLVGCVSDNAAIGTAPLPIPDQTSAVTTEDLLIGPMDTVSVRVFGVSDFDGDYQVDSRGNIVMPLVGPIGASGATPTMLAQRIEMALGERYLRDPNVNVSIEQSISRRVTVDGSVNRPNLYPIEGNISLLQAVALAGGPSDGANAKKVLIFRTVDGERRAAAFNLDAIRSGKAADPSVFGNDIIVVDGSEARKTYGDFIRSMPLLTTLFIAF